MLCLELEDYLNPLSRCQARIPPGAGSIRLLEAVKHFDRPLHSRIIPAATA
jgi:hypothetical protein